MARLHEDLLEQAFTLVTKEKKKPKQASVRRAVSSAYYSLFHFLSDKVTEGLIGTPNDVADMRAWLRRALEHGTMKSACEFFGKPSANSFLLLQSQLNFTPNNNLKAIADAFVNLQELRHRADYDLSKPITRLDALFAIAEARLAVSAWHRLEKIDPRLTLIFCVSLLHWSKLSTFAKS